MRKRQAVMTTQKYMVGKSLIFGILYGFIYYIVDKITDSHYMRIAILGVAVPHLVYLMYPSWYVDRYAIARQSMQDAACKTYRLIDTALLHIFAYYVLISLFAGAEAIYLESGVITRVLIGGAICHLIYVIAKVWRKQAIQRRS